MKKCSRCNKIKPLGEFHRNCTRSDGRCYWCRECNSENTRQWHARHPGYHRQLVWKCSGIQFTVEDFEAKWVQQKGLCAICEEPMLPRRPKRSGRGQGRWAVVDHDHSSFKVRALLCDPCNKGLGHFHDNPAALRKAAQYLEFWRVQ